jgi:Skp family chaperone for outer membrane proteins
MKHAYLAILALVVLCVGMRQLQAMHNEELINIKRRINQIEYQGYRQSYSNELDDLYERQSQLERLETREALEALRKAKPERESLEALRKEKSEREALEAFRTLHKKPYVTGNDPDYDVTR